MWSMTTLSCPASTKRVMRPSSSALGCQERRAALIPCSANLGASAVTMVVRSLPLARRISGGHIQHGIDSSWIERVDGAGQVVLGIVERLCRAQAGDVVRNLKT